MVIMVIIYIRKPKRRITYREIGIQAGRKVISDKCEKSEVITEFGILFYLFIIILNYNISLNYKILGRAAGPHSIYTPPESISIVRPFQISLGGPQVADAWFRTI